MRSAASVKDRLKIMARESGKTMQELLAAYGLERTLYRLSVSPYVDHFTLKGGILLYAWFDGSFPRATTDIDLLADRISNGMEDMKRVFAEIFTLPVDDPLQFDVKSLRVVSISEFKQYHGVNVSIIGYLDRTRVPISIDVGFGDVIYPERTVLDFPTLLGDETPKVYAYSLASSAAEKFEAIVALAYNNSRFKDFYDLYVLASSYDFDGAVLKEAVRETFENRHTELGDIAAFEEDFSVDPVRISRWKAFVKKKRAMLPVTLAGTIHLMRDFMMPIVEALQQGKDFAGTWHHEERKWNFQGSRDPFK